MNWPWFDSRLANFLSLTSSTYSLVGTVMIIHLKRKFIEMLGTSWLQVFEKKGLAYYAHHRRQQTEGATSTEKVLCSLASPATSISKINVPDLTCHYER